MLQKTTSPIIASEIPEEQFDFHKFAITGEANELADFDFLSTVTESRPERGFWMTTTKGRVLFIHIDTEMDGDRLVKWTFRSCGWTPHGKQAFVSIYNG